MVHGDVPHAREPRTRKACLALLALAALLFVALRVPFLSVPLERDEGEYAYIAQRMLEGDVPYRDAFDQKPPGIFALYLAAFALFGQSVEAIHGFMYLWTLGTLAALHALVSGTAGALAAAFAALAFAVLSIDPRLVATAANTEIFLLLPLVASTALLQRGLERDRAPLWLACGALAAAACWIKPVAAANALFLVLFAAGTAFAGGSGGRAARAARRVAWLAGGAAAVSLPVLLALARVDALSAFMDAVVWHNLSYGRNVSLEKGIRYASAALGDQAPSLAACWALALLGLALPGALPRRSHWLLGGFALGSAAGVSWGLYFRPHYFVLLLPALCALAGVGAAALARPLAAAPPAARWAGMAALAALVAVPPPVANRSLLRASPSQISREIYGVNPFVESARIAEYLRRTSEPDESIYIVGSEPQILFHAGRRSATRYIIFYPLTGPYPDALERQRELMREIEVARPRYVVWVDLRASLLVGAHSERWVFDSTVDLIERDYALELLALPPLGTDVRDKTFDFVYGARAREVFEEARAGERAMQGIAVFRRTH